MKIPENFEPFIDDLIESTRKIEGHLTPKETKFLALAASYPTAKGEILEIGCFKGRSTVVLAKSAKLAGQNTIVSVDPLISPSVTDPDLKGADSCFDDFINNIRNAGVEDNVEFYQTYSYELAKEWNRKIRLLWIDGDHTYDGTLLDFEKFSPFLADGAIIAFHDALHCFDGPVRVFTENVLFSPNFGSAGICGSIAWAQYFDYENADLRYREQKQKLYLKMSRIIPYCVFKQKLTGLNKLKYKLYRARIPHSEVVPSKWIKQVIVKE